MELNTLLETILALASGENLLLVGGAAACCLLTNLTKKLLPKLKIDLTHSFDPTAYLPFIFGLLIGVGASFFKKFAGIGERISFIAVETMSMGALSTVLYKIVSSISGTGLKQLLKDDAFSLFYNQLLTLSDAKKRLLDGSLSEKDFVGTIQTLVANTGAIYSGDSSDEAKKQKLITLLGGIIDGDTVEKVIESLHRALSKMY